MTDPETIVENVILIEDVMYKRWTLMDVLHYNQYLRNCPIRKVTVQINRSPDNLKNGNLRLNQSFRMITRIKA